MRIGVPKEVKDNEYRVGMIPAAAHALSSARHEVRVHVQVLEEVLQPLD